MLFGMSKLQQTFWRVTEYGGVIGVSVIWITLLRSIHIAGFSFFDKRPLSDLALSVIGESYTDGLLIAGIFVGLFFINITQKFHPTRAFKLTVAVALICQFIIAVIPDTIAGRASLLHWIAGGVLALSIIMSLWQFAATRGLSECIKHWTIRAFWAMVVLLIPEAYLVANHTMFDSSELINVAIFTAWIVYINARAHSPISNKLNDASQ
jgi:hypothetical protein